MSRRKPYSLEPLSRKNGKSARKKERRHTCGVGQLDSNQNQYELISHATRGHTQEKATPFPGKIECSTNQFGHVAVTNLLTFALALTSRSIHTGAHSKMWADTSKLASLQRKLNNAKRRESRRTAVCCRGIRFLLNNTSEVTLGVDFSVVGGAAEGRGQCPPKTCRACCIAISANQQALIGRFDQINPLTLSRSTDRARTRP